MSGFDAVDGSHRRHLGAKLVVPFDELKLLLLAITPRQSRLVSTSGMAPASDIQMAMSGFELISSAMPSASDVADSRSIRGLLTRFGHSEDGIYRDQLRRIPVFRASA